MTTRRRTDTPEPEPATLIWERPEPAERPSPAPLSRDRIVRAAMTLADTDGLDAVSVRKVAAALDAGPMRLYGYLSTKDELLDLMAEAVHAEIADALAHDPPAADWRTTLHAHAHHMRDAALRHEWFADLLGGRPHLGPAALTTLDAALAAAARHPGLADPDAAFGAVGTLHAYTAGAVRREIAERRAHRATGLDKRQWQTSVGPYLTRMLATGRYPAVARIVAGAKTPDPATAFDTGLRHVLDGIAAVTG
ncbi:TetR/AcrR family transcriptional regulator [Yinghuangia seranimata]|uniref:TetR/AcrR family transcriptional regulator n=1 Tax=Yinghuangia seranimata TaxID=408067 RepID=UPI00248B6BB0|nr:TetR/AcrR family transcriptional regulator C-terminal domain-containing protein [Yinghuangia seranimata]MDI2129172.1 TetR/AcrR family transcriptional regulator C-terminal domain-containing protein [Yinghuangia seranimata]